MRNSMCSTELAVPRQVRQRHGHHTRICLDSSRLNIAHVGGAAPPSTDKSCPERATRALIMCLSCVTQTNTRYQLTTSCSAIRASLTSPLSLSLSPPSQKPRISLSHSPPSCCHQPQPAMPPHSCSNSPRVLSQPAPCRGRPQPRRILLACDMSTLQTLDGGLEPAWLQLACHTCPPQSLQAAAASRPPRLCRAACDADETRMQQHIMARPCMVMGHAEALLR
jgi:hypothetical protein